MITFITENKTQIYNPLFIAADEATESHSDEQRDEIIQPVPSPDVIPPSPPPPLPDIQTPKCCRGRGKGVVRHQTTVALRRGRGRSVRSPQITVQLHGDTENQDRQPQATAQVCGDTENEHREPQTNALVCRDTGNEDRLPQAAVQARVDAENEDRQPRVAVEIHVDAENEDRQPQVAAQVYRGRKNEYQAPGFDWIWNDILPGGNYRPLDTPFTGDVGITHPMIENPEPIGFFKLYFTDEVYVLIARETNRYAHQYIQANAANLGPRSTVHRWKDTTASEIKAFLGLCVLMGISYKPRVWMYWSKDSLYSSPIFGQVMARQRFQLILRFLHFQDNEDPQYNQQDLNRDRLFKIRNILKKTREKFKTVYYPSEDITLDESLVLYKGRLLFKQYIKTKRSRFGIKFFELITADGILLDFMIYQGNMEPALFQPPGENWLITERIPLTLAQPYLDKGHTLTLDNWYTTPKLADYLMERSTKLVGTIRANRKNFPKDFPADKAMPKGSAACKYHQQILVMKYRAAQNKAPSKPKIVHVISTKHGSRMQNTTRRDAEGNIVQKPKAILYYNRKMGGVDTMDQQLHGIQMMRKTSKWYH